VSSRILSFADGFTSASAPTGSTGTIESYTVNNGASSQALFTLLSTQTKTVFSDYELIRSSSLGEFKQDGSLVFRYSDGSWSITYGNYSGDEMFVDSIVNNEHCLLVINSGTGAVTISSGTLGGTSYVGTLKLNNVRIA
jgi:hypothetical protein